MSHVIETPTLLGRTTGEALLAFAGQNWSLDEFHWLSDSVVELTLRKYPGNHLPIDIVATIACAVRTARVGQQELQSLQDVEAALTWRTATPASPLPPLDSVRP